MVNILFSHHMLLHAVAALPGWEKRLNGATVGHKNGGNAVTTNRLAFLHKEAPMPDGSSLLPAQVHNPQEKMDQPA